MLFEMRTYPLPPSRLKDYLAICAEKGKSLQCDVLGHRAGVTRVNPLVHSTATEEACFKMRASLTGGSS